MTALLSVLACLLVVSLVQGYPKFAQDIPNGNKVPNPGAAGKMWAGVGHVNSRGGGKLNPFGKDFKANGFKWTEALCKKDSDGDGQTNGQELGDPGCTWKKGGQMKPSAVTHPGVKNPKKRPVPNPAP